MSDKQYSIPAKYRRTENMHILLWLLKDICWATNLRVPGLIMIVPTLTVAVLITWQTRHMKSELFHNLAVDFWITANCTWMIGEFFHLDENIWHGYGLRQASIIPFAIGLGVLAYYYAVLYRRKENEFERVEEAVESASTRHR
ncbi:MAG TPA: hypothetical protein VL307_10370 [Chitinophagaceae bacterium]|nr:hypothetical protein [Chitinophagaceae bacterium]